jgi:hypothetical protein
MRIQVVEADPDHVRLRISRIDQPLHLVHQIELRAPPRGEAGLDSLRNRVIAGASTAFRRMRAKSSGKSNTARVGVSIPAACAL